jgi:hypothetical protein
MNCGFFQVGRSSLDRQLSLRNIRRFTLISTHPRATLPRLSFSRLPPSPPGVGTSRPSIPVEHLTVGIYRSRQLFASVGSVLNYASNETDQANGHTHGNGHIDPDEGNESSSDEEDDDGERDGMNPWPTLLGLFSPREVRFQPYPEQRSGGLQDAAVDLYHMSLPSPWSHVRTLEFVDCWPHDFLGRASFVQRRRPSTSSRPSHSASITADADSSRPLPSHQDDDVVPLTVIYDLDLRLSPPLWLGAAFFFSSALCPHLFEVETSRAERIVVRVRTEEEREVMRQSMERWLKPMRLKEGEKERWRGMVEFKIKKKGLKTVREVDQAGEDDGDDQA